MGQELKYLGPQPSHISSDHYSQLCSTVNHTMGDILPSHMPMCIPRVMQPSVLLGKCLKPGMRESDYESDLIRIPSISINVSHYNDY